MLLLLLGAALTVDSAALRYRDCKKSGMEHEDINAWAKSLGFSKRRIISSSEFIGGEEWTAKTEDGKTISFSSLPAEGRDSRPQELFRTIVKNIDVIIPLPAEDFHAQCFAKGAERGIVLVISENYQREYDIKLHHQQINKRIEFYIELIDYFNRLKDRGLYHDGLSKESLYLEKGNFSRFAILQINTLEEVPKDKKHKDFLLAQNGRHILDEIEQIESSLMLWIKRADPSFKLKKGLYKYFLEYLQEARNWSNVATVSVLRKQLVHLQDFLRNEKSSAIKKNFNSRVIAGAPEMLSSDSSSESDTTASHSRRSSKARSINNSQKSIKTKTRSTHR